MKDNILKLKAYGRTYKVLVEVNSYVSNDNLAIQLVNVKNREPFATLTVNLDIKLPSNFAFVDTNNCPWAEEFIRENNLGSFVGHCEQSGYCFYPLYVFHLNSSNMEGGE